MNAPHALRKELAELIGEVTQAKVKAGIGQRLDLSALPDRISQICEAIAALPKDQAQPYLQIIGKLTSDLDVLSGDLRHRHEELQQRLGSLLNEPSAASDGAD